MDVQKTLALSLSVTNLFLFLGSALYYNQTLARMSSDIKKLNDTIEAVEKQLAGHVSQSVGATNTKVADLKRQMDEATRAASALKTQVKTLSQGQTLQMEQLVSVLGHLEGVSDEEKKKLAATVKQLSAAQQPPRSALRRTRFEDEEEEVQEEARPAPRRRQKDLEDEEDEEARPAPRRRQKDPEDEEDEEDVDARLAAVRRRRQRAAQQ
jgi:integrase